VTSSFLPSVESQASGAANPFLDDAPRPAALGDQSQTGAGPRGDPAIEVLGLEAAQAESLGGSIASGAAAAYRDDDLLPRHLRQARAELAERNVLRALDVAGIPLVLLAHVEKMEVGTPLADVLRKHRPILAHGGDVDSNAVRERLELVPETPYCVEDAEREQQSSTR